MNKIKLAKFISLITNPPIICIPLFIIICLALSFENGIFNLEEFIVLEIVSFVFTSLLPFAIIFIWAKKIGSDSDISNRTDRFIPMIIGIVSYFIGFLICLINGLDNFLTILLLCYSINTGIVLIITFKWKISVHTTGLSGPVGALILLLGPFGAILGVLYPIVVWSRVLLKKHTLAQAICGGVQGFFLTILEAYLFFDLFKFPVLILTGLVESIFFILAIILTPVILSILSYINPSRLLFIILEVICLLIFLLLMPFDAFLIFITVSLTSILISYFAGCEFVWFKVLNSS